MTHVPQTTTKATRHESARLMIKVVSNRGLWHGSSPGTTDSMMAVITQGTPRRVYSQSPTLGYPGSRREQRLARKIKGPAAVRATHENVSQTMIQPAGESPLRTTWSMWTEAIAEPITRATPSSTLMSRP